ncbi:5-formyltetrahydrofolate cyclo-ligase [Bordetella sp. 2513F-2]
MAIQNTAQDNAVALRARLRQARAGIPERDRARGALLMRGRLFSWLNAARAQLGGNPLSVAAFWPMDHEPDLRPLLEQWAGNGIRVCLPRMQAPGEPLAFHAWEPGMALEAGRHGIQEPRSGEPCVPDVVLVPTLGYTGEADRLGYGGGYYDRTLAALAAAGHRPVAIGIAWAEGLLPPDYRPAPHDVRLDAVLTPEGWVPAAPLDAAPSGPAAPSRRFILR